MNPFEFLLTTPILNVLVATFKLFESFSLPGALGLAIITLTVIIRLILWPLTTTQLKSTQKIAALKPHLDEIKKTHGHDKTKHQQEVAKLYKEHGVNPIAGCLPLLLQIPIFIALYNVLLNIVEFEKADFLTSINERLYSTSLHLETIPQTDFLGFNLATQPSQWQQLGIVILAVPIVTGLLQFVQTKMIMPASSPKSKKNEPKKGGFEESMAQIQSQMTFIMPLVIAFFSYGFPVGLSLYWNTFTIIGIIQQYAVVGAGPLNKYLPKNLQKSK